MKFLKALITILIIVSIFIALDYFTLSDTWRFYGWELFTKGKTGTDTETVFSAHSAPTGKGIFPDSAYVFTRGWHVLHMADWEKHLAEFRDKPAIDALEIGSFEGFSAIWQLEHVLTSPNSTITCIDIFDDQVTEKQFDRNIEASGVSYKVRKLKGSSEKMLRGLNPEQYEYVYIDGSHLAKWVLSDAVLSWDLVKPGGLVIFDDYRFLPKRPEWYNPSGLYFIDEYLWKRKARKTAPELAIDAFIKIYEPYMEVVFKKYQVVIRKKAGN